MKRLVVILLILWSFSLPVGAVELEPPEAPEGVLEYIPEQTESFGDGLWLILKQAIEQLRPELARAGGICAALMGVALLISVLDKVPGTTRKPAQMAGVAAVSALLIGTASTMVKLGASTVAQLSEYGKLLFPVLTAGLAAQGGAAGSAALYAATTAFDAVLGTVIGKLLVPLVYIFLALGIANSAMGEDLLKKLRDLIKWLVTWCLKNILYIFTGYMALTKVISGTTDAAALKATKLTISGMVPVVGGILSDASETVLVGAAVMKNAVGIYGLWTIAAILIWPFLQIGVQYLLLKLTGSVCAVFGVKVISELVQDFSTAMGFLLGMTGSVTMLLLVSVVCFMKGGM